VIHVILPGGFCTACVTPEAHDAWVAAQLARISRTPVTPWASIQLARIHDSSQREEPGAQGASST
jgi:hypothetical protein